MTNKIMKISSKGDHILKFLNPVQIILHLWQYRDLIRQLTWRDVMGRYKGSFVGLGWSFIHPLLMLCVYTFVFSVIFKARWGVNPDETRASFALALFMGLITFGIFSEVINSAPGLVLANANYVKKVVFPLEILVTVKLLSALINALFSLIILLTGTAFVQGIIHWTVIILPLVWLPIIMFTLGCGYFLASLGVFIRDISATIGILTTMLFFLTPIFYPINAVPEQFRFILRLNPISIFVEDSRKAVLWGLFPDWNWFIGGLIFSLLIWILGFIWFMKSKRAFADVI